MMDFSQMVIHFVVALALGALMGVERELAGKEAGIRTSMLVSGGAALFAIIGINLPYLVAVSPEHIPDVIARNSGFLAVIANIVIGIGFLGAGIIIKTQEHVVGLTTAAVIWAAAGIGTLAGVGLTKFAITVTVMVSVLLYILRRMNIAEKIRPPQNSN